MINHEKTVLLTGGTGFLGGNLLRKLIAKKNRVLVLVRETSDLSRLTDVLGEITLIRIEKTDFVRLFKESNICCVIHCATDYGRAVKSPFSMLEANLMLPLKLLHIGNENGLQCFVNIDTLLAKGVSQYSLTKHQFKDWLKVYSDRILCVNVALEHFYGPYDDNSKFTTWVIQSMLENLPEIQLTKGDQRRDFIFVDDVVNAITVVLSALPDKRKGYLSYEIGTGKAIPVRDFVVLVKKLTKNSKTKLKFGALPYRVNEVMESKANLKAIKALGWSPKVPLKEGLRWTIEREGRRITL